MKKLIVLAAIVSATSVYAANWGFWNYDRSWIGLLQHTSTNWYSIWNGAPGTFHGANLGTYDITINDPLKIVAYDAKTWKSTGGDVTGIEYYYRVYETNATGGSFTVMPGGWMQNLGDGNQKWGNHNLNVNLLAGTSGGKTYYVEIYGRISGTGDPTGWQYDSNNGANYKAIFTVIPEPSSIVLVAAGVMGLWMIRRRRAH